MKTIEATATNAPTGAAAAAQQQFRHRAEQFAVNVMDIVNAGALSMMISMGHRTGLFDTMSRTAAPATPVAIAAAAGLSERYVREWLGAMFTGGIVEHDHAAGTYHLPPEHAACLTRAAAPNNIAVSAQWIAVLGHVEDEVTAAFRHGRGVPYSAYRRFHEVMAEESAQTVVGGLFNHILPLVPGLDERLEAGIHVLDVGCGSGMAMIAMAATYPLSRFHGIDFSEQAIARAQAEAARRRLSNVHFEARDVAVPDDRHCGGFDLVTAFDAIHDQARPAEVLANVRAALRPGGVFLMQDIQAHTCHHDNAANPLAPMIYTISCMHCMSVSLANGGPGLGAAWGKEKALEMLAAAGFSAVRVETLPHDPLNFYYVAR